MKLIKYGGAMCDSREYNAIMKSVKASIKSGNWQAGLEAKKMEAESSKYLGVKYGLLTNSGSSAGLLALSALELPKGSEVIISAVTFPTIFNIIIQCGLIPVVVDAKVGTYNFDVDEVEKAITKKTKAIIAIHALGNPVDMPKLMKVAKKHKVYVIEDNCDGWGSSISGKWLGSFGDLSITSWHAAHIASCGVGGSVFSNNKVLIDGSRQYRDWGRIADTNKPHTVKALPKDHNPRFVYDKIGYNFQILELQAAMGRVQLRKAKEIKRLRKANFDYLDKHLPPECIRPVTVDNAEVCWFAFPITYLGDRGALVAHLEKNGIETRSMFSGDITKHPAYKDSKFRISGKLEEADVILKHSFWVGVHPSMTQKQREYMIKTFNDFCTPNNTNSTHK